MAAVAKSQTPPAAPSFDLRRAVKWFVIAAAVFVFLAWLSPYIAAQKPGRLVESAIRGVLVGAVYALVGLGIVIINKASGVFNFAHGYMMLLGGLIFHAFFSVTQVDPAAAALFSGFVMLMLVTLNGWRELRKPRRVLAGIAAAIVLTVILSIPGQEFQLIRAFVGGMLGAAALGLAVERFTIRPLIGQPLFTAVMMTLAIGEMLHGVTQMVWGSVEIPLPVFEVLKRIGLPARLTIEGEGTWLDVPRIVINLELIVAFALAVVAFLGFVAFFRFTNVGLAMRATAENQQLAQSVGLRVRVILAAAWAIAALLAAIAGIGQGGATSLSQNLPGVAFYAFPAVLLGGVESISGVFVGGIVIGLVQELSKRLFPGLQVDTELAPYLVLMLVLVIRPDGLFGQKRIERI
jgi:branched-chain amino acid transport system permease protein